MEGLHYPCSENKDVFVFAYVNSRFSHDAAQTILNLLNYLIALRKFSVVKLKQLG